MTNNVRSLPSRRSKELLDGDNKWYCSDCKEHVRASKKLCIWHVPPVLIVHLKRFWDRGGKINSVVRYPVTAFDLAPYVASPGKPGSTEYDLFSIALHHGGSNGGHYTR